MIRKRFGVGGVQLVPFQIRNDGDPLRSKVEKQRAANYRPLRTRLLLSLGVPAFALTRHLERLVRRRAASEWQYAKSNPAGDQMFVIFRREAVT